MPTTETKDKLSCLLDNRMDPMTQAKRDYYAKLIEEADAMLEHAEIDEGDPSWACGLTEVQASRLLRLRNKSMRKREEIERATNRLCEINTRLHAAHESMNDRERDRLLEDAKLARQAIEAMKDL